MPCYRPITAYRVAGQKQLVFGERQLTSERSGETVAHEVVQLRCGKCFDCLSYRAKRWTARIMQEASCFDQEAVWFLSFTYDPEHLPPDGGLRYRDFQLFMKRLRKATGGGVRFVMCGEYGDYGRPHYHAIIFGLRLEDVHPVGRGHDGTILHGSKTITDLWGQGFVDVGEFTEGRAQYVAKYLVKVEEVPPGRYVDPETGETTDRKKPFLQMSLRPGIGREWYEKFGASDYAPTGCAILAVRDDSGRLHGRRVGGNAYFDSLLKQRDPIQYEWIKEQRREAFVEPTPEDLQREEAFAVEMAKRSKRNKRH